MEILYKVSEIASVLGLQWSLFDGACGQEAGGNVSLLFWFLQSKAVVGITAEQINCDGHLAQEEQEDAQQEEDDGAEDGEYDGEVW